MKSNDNDNYHLYFELTDINVIKTFFESFANDIDIVRLTLRKNKINTELDITGANSTRTYYIKSKFYNGIIKNYYLSESIDEMEIQIELVPCDLINILKSYEFGDNLLVLYAYSNNKNIMFVEFKQEKQKGLEFEMNDKTNNDSDSINKSKKVKSTNKIKKVIVKEKKYSLNIGYPIYPEKQISKINFEKKITICAKKFHKVCKDLGTLFKNIKISSKNNKSLCLGYNNSKCDGLIKFNYDESNVLLENLLNSKTNNISGVYCVEDIVRFSKLSEISTNYYFKIKNNYFLESVFTISDYGIINVSFIPLKEDIMKNSIDLADLDKKDNLSNSSNSSNASDTSNSSNLSIKKTQKTINDKIIYVEIEKIELFKNVLECVEKIVLEPIFKLCSDNGEMKINIFCSSNSKNMNLDINLKNIFGRYKNLLKPIDLGIGLKYLNDILKNVNKTERVIMSIDPNDKQNLNIQIKNGINSTTDMEFKRIYKIKLLNVEETEQIQITNKTELSKRVCKISIESDEFYKISKDINTIGNEIKISYDYKNLIFSSINECKYVNIIKKDNCIININEYGEDGKEKNKIINEFDVKDIMIFSKLASSMEEFEINLRTDGRLIIQSNFTEISGSIMIQLMSKNLSEIIPNDKNMLKSDVEIMNDKIIFFKLKKINFMKNIIDTLDKIVSDVEWVFTTDNTNTEAKINDEDTEVKAGLEMVCVDPSKTLYVKTKLTSELFKSYYCEKNIFKFGMNLEFFNKILKLTDKGDIALYCYIEKNDPSNLIVRFKNSEKKNKRIFKIPLQIINIKKDNTQISFEFEKKITMGTDSLFSRCKMIGNTSQFVKIVCDGEKILFKCVGEKEGIITLDSTDDTILEIINLNDEKVEGSFEVKNILMFSRLGTITKNFSLYMKNNFALISVYGFGDCGSINVILSPSTEEHINNQLYDYSDDEDDIELLNTNSNQLDFY